MACFNTLLQRLACFMLINLLLALPTAAIGATYYVNSLIGNDANNGLSAATPWKTITYAAANVPAGIPGTPNIIMVAAGTYDTAGNGETFPINFATNYVSLTGTGAAVTNIDTASAVTNALYVTAMGFSVSGFSFENAERAIDITEGGFSITNNVFEAGVASGIYLYRFDLDLSASVTFADMAITDNTFQTTSYGVYIDVNQDFDYTVENLSATFGNFIVSGNNFPVTSGSGFYVSQLSYNELLNGTLTAGVFSITNNTFTGGEYGVRFSGQIGYMEDTIVSVGNLVVDGNTCTNQSTRGIDVDYWAVDDFYGATRAVFANLSVSGNTVTAPDYLAYPDADGIYIDQVEDIVTVHGTTTITTGTVNIANNSIDVDGYGIHFDSQGIEAVGEEFFNDTARVTTGQKNISGNTINSNDNDGIYLDLDDVCYGMYGSTEVTWGPLTIAENTITSSDESIDFSIDDMGRNLHDNSKCTIGRVTVEANDVTAHLFEAIEFYFDYTSYQVFNNAVFFAEPFTVDNNTVEAEAHEGIYVNLDDSDNTAEMEDNAQGSLPDWIITNNTIDVEGGFQGIEFYITNTPKENHAAAMSHFGSILIDNNILNQDRDTGMEHGIYIDIQKVVANAYGPAVATYGDITITNNSLYSLDSEGIYVAYDDVGFNFSGAPLLTIGNLEIGHNTIDMATGGIEVDFSRLFTEEQAQVAIGEVNIHDNILSDISFTGIFLSYFGTNDSPGNATLTIGAPTVDGNQINGAPGSGSGIYVYLEKATDGITFGKPIISGNTIAGFLRGIYLEGLEEATLRCNYLENNSLYGIQFMGTGSNFTVHENSLVNNNVGLFVADSYVTVVDAENNWWGDVRGPAACASCNRVYPGDMGTVDYAPWLVGQIEKTRCGTPFPWVMFIPAITGAGM